MIITLCKLTIALSTITVLDVFGVLHYVLAVPPTFITLPRRHNDD